MAAWSEAKAPANAPVAVPVDSAATELEIDDPRWAALVESHEDALAFHRPEWARLLAECYGYRPFVLAVTGADGGLLGGLPVAEVRGLRRRRRWVALPFTDACPPLLRADLDPDGFSEALEAARRSARISALQVRAEAFGGDVHYDCSAVTHSLSLEPGPDALFARFHKQVKRGIARAEREGVVVRRGETEADLVGTYYGLHVLTRRRLGVPVQPRRFFELLWRRLLEPGFGHVLLVYAGSQAVAGAVFLTGGSTITYKFGASDASAWGLRPNHALFSTAIYEACEAGYRSFDFGRSDLGDQGLRDFKSNWGAAEEPLVYSTLGARPAAPAKSISPGVVSGILRRSPTFVCRAAGALLYRYAA